MNQEPIKPLFQQPGPAPAAERDALSAALGSAFGFLLIATGALAAVWLVSGLRIVDAGSQAVVRRLGAIDRLAGPGLLLAWPAPFEDVQILPGPDRQLRMDIDRLDLPGRDTGATLPATIGGDPRRSGGYALSGDAGVVHVRATVVYAIADARAFAIADPDARRDPSLPPTSEAMIRRGLQAALITACARRNLDEVLVASPDARDAERSEAMAASRERLRTDVASDLNRRLAMLRCGLNCLRVDLAAYLPEKAKPAFDAVVQAEGIAARDVAEARTAATKIEQETQAACASIRIQAQAKAEELLATARVATDRIRAVQGERDPDRRRVLLTRLYRERIDALLTRSSTTLIGGDAGARVVVPAR